MKGRFMPAHRAHRVIDWVSLGKYNHPFAKTTLFSGDYGLFYRILLMQFVRFSTCLILLTAAVSLHAADPSPLPRAEDLMPEVVAVVNGVELSRDQFAGLAISLSSSQLMQELVFRELVRQEAEEQGIAISETELDTYLQLRIDIELQRLASALGAKSPEEAEKALQAQGISIETFRKNARRMLRPHAIYELLRGKLIRQTITLSEDGLRAAFVQRYGPKVSVMQIVSPTRKDADGILKKLELGAEFDDVAKKFSIDPVSRRDGGQLPPLPVDSALGKAVGGLKPGEISDVVQLGEGFHVLKFVENIEAEDVQFEDVKGMLREQLMQRVIADKGPAFLMELQSKAQIESRL